MTANSESDDAPRARIRALPSNDKGRDLIVGDPHGCRSVFDRALEQLDFDPAVDRVLVVGDLVDRGPDSPGCLALLDEPWFHSILGNHEAMLAQRLEGGARGARAALLHSQNGGHWLPGNPDDADLELARHIHLAAELPHMLVVGDGDTRYHLVHAELPSGTTGPVAGDAAIDAGLPGTDPETLVWQRDLMVRPDGAQLPPEAPGLATTYCGHTPAPAVRRRLSHVCLDTGAVFGWLGHADPGLGLTVVERRGAEEVGVHHFPTARVG